MFCSKCGKDNPAGVEKCKFCGEAMPKKSGSGGFADILKFEGAAPAANTDVKNVGNEMELKRIHDRLNSMSDRVQKQGLFSLGAVAVCLLVAIISLCVSCSALKNVDELDAGDDKRKKNLTEQQDKGDEEEKPGGDSTTTKQEEQPDPDNEEPEGDAEIKTWNDLHRHYSGEHATKTGLLAMKTKDPVGNIDEADLQKAEQYLNAVGRYLERAKTGKNEDELEMPQVTIDEDEYELEKMTVEEVKTQLDKWLGEVDKLLDEKPDKD